MTEHTWQEAINKLEVPTSATGSLNAIIAGILKGEGTVKGYIDNANLIWAIVPLIRAGATGQLLLGVGSLAPFSVPGIITQVRESMVIDGKASWEFGVELSALAGTGIYTRAG